MAKIVTDAAGVAAETPGVVRDVSNWAQELQTLTSGNELSSSTELLVNLLGRIYEAFLKNKHLQEEIVKALDSKEGAMLLCGSSPFCQRPRILLLRHKNAYTSVSIYYGTSAISVATLCKI
ncbi:hypothetical protein HOLleu_20327 [Holothuria leucospilota]|uniref:Uncharacterized protein n=1 Tax=Holothuria leucospilota TaxID=206669 RepID=A0A9Q1H7X6_HOLLE|nr:hypothetical protein HOLleu_20327 [Holothuria leucospilota]